ncbi:hypothetical protein SUGI_0137170 [Cryptomeria japonica]|nr:hypothetical protein SUGI_0137170 [Cryptomeria japonica]
MTSKTETEVYSKKWARASNLSGSSVMWARPSNLSGSSVPVKPGCRGSTLGVCWLRQNQPMSQPNPILSCIVAKTKLHYWLLQGRL